MNPEFEARMLEDDLGGIRYWDDEATFIEARPQMYPPGILWIMREEQARINRDLSKRFDELLFGMLAPGFKVRILVDEAPKLNKLLLLCGPSL